MKAESELSDKEWRQMRRQMAKLEFEPVPEAPALLLRSLYGESDKELGSIEVQEDKPDETRESASVGDECPNYHDSPKHKSSAILSSPCNQLQKQSEITIRGASRELPSTSMAVSPMLTSRFRPREQKRPTESKLEINDAEIAALDAQMAAALEASRRSVMGGFMELKAKTARSETLERMKLSAAHTNDAAILQSQVKELKEKLARAEARQEEQNLLLDRFSEFAAKRSDHNQIRWGGDCSLAACFHAWNASAQQLVKKRSALYHVLAQSCKRQQLASFRYWKESMHRFDFQNQLQDQWGRYEHRIVEVAKEYQLKILQLQQEIEEAKNQVAESQKCRQKLEEDLRLIFLRGVSAMNIEVLTVFGSNQKQILKQGEQDRLISHSKTAAVLNNTPSNERISPEAVPPSPTSPAFNTSLEASVRDPVEVEGPSTKYSNPSHARESVLRPSYPQIPSDSSRGVNEWSRVSTTSALRSAELIRQHELSAPVVRQSTTRSTSSSYRPSSAPSPTKKRSSSRLNAKHEVEMQYMRSTIAASAARAADAGRGSLAFRLEFQLRGMNRHQTDVEAQQSSSRLETGDDAYGDFGQFNAKGVFDDDDEEDGIDLEGYEEYLEHLRRCSKVAVRPCSARVVRPMPMDTMNIPDNPVPTRPVRPVSARPRMRTTPRNQSSDSKLSGSQTRSSGGVRRKRQGEKLVHARIRAVYNDVGHSKQMAAPYSAASVNSKSNSFQDAEMHDEFYRLLDAETELKAACLQQQQKRVKAIAHVRRLEEILATKDKKIESLLHTKVVGAAQSTNRSVVQREMAERERKFHALAQKLREKISQQSQLLSSYEEAMQSLRSGMKNTNLMELEEERSQLYQELSHHQELSKRQRLEWESHQQKLLAFAEAKASNKFQISRLQQENKVISHEKRKLEQDVEFLKSRVELLQNNLALEQRKRTYDRDFSGSAGKHALSSPTQKVMLAHALEEMKKLVRRESISSNRRDKLKSPKPTTVAPRPDKYFSPTTTTPSVKSSALKTPSKASVVSPRLSRPSSAAPTCSNGTAARQPPSFKVDAVSAATTCSSDSPAAPSPHTSTYHDGGKLDLPPKVKQQVSFTKCNYALVTADQSDEKNPENHPDQQINEALSDTITDHADTRTDKQEQDTPVSQPYSCLEADPPRVQQSDGEAVDEDQMADDEMAAMQQQQLAAAESALKLDVDDDLDSESSADLLDDAQHPMLRSEADSRSSDDAILFEMGVLNGKSDSMQDAALDDLYPSDFLDTEAQVSAEDEDDNDDS